MKINPLSPLEQDILEELWPNKNLKVRQLHELLKKKKKVALTSIAVSLDRLHNKGVVGRTIQTGRGGLRYVYFPSKSQEETKKTFVESAVNKIIETFGSVAISYFNERFKNR